ncbi:hypothetical protein [Falsiroseomonas sp.]|uniref:hypothetical protein n=1 Tax=Falsiroseomonas sp. TaxID=2870721 RepID=UPI003F72ED33
MKRVGEAGGRQRRGRWRGAMAALPMLGVAAGCAPELPDLAVEPQWAAAMARLSMFGIYPAREDVMVGDLLLYVPARGGGGPVEGEIARTLATRLASPPCWLLMRELGWQGRERPRLQPIPTASSAEQTAPANPAVRPETAGTGYGAQGDVCSRGERGNFEIGSSDDLRATPAVRLQRAEVPKLTVARLTEGQLSGQGIFGPVGATLGLSASGNTALTVELKNLETLRLDPPRVSDLLRQLLVRDFRHWQGEVVPEEGRERIRRGDARLALQDREHRFHPADLIRALDQRSSRERPLATLACAGDFAALARHGARVIAVNDVMYARNITFSFNRSSGAAARLALDLQEVLGLGRATVPGAAPGPSPDAAAAAPDPAAEARKVAEDRLRRLRALAGAAPGADAAVRAEFIVSSTGELALSTTTARPLAVGFAAALEYPIEHALIPTAEWQIAEAQSVCGTLVHQPMSARTEALLRGNLAWLHATSEMTASHVTALAQQSHPLPPGVAPSRHLLAPIFPRQR